MSHYPGNSQDLMQAVKPSKTLYLLALISLMPLLFSVILAMYFWLGLEQYTGKTLHWARLNSYIYAHSYGAILLSMFAGIQLSQALKDESNPLILAFNFSLFLLAWLSFKSFADFNGLVFLTTCWLASVLYTIHQLKQHPHLHSLYKLKIKLQLCIMLFLTALILING